MSDFFSFYSRSSRFRITFICSHSIEVLSSSHIEMSLAFLPSEWNFISVWDLAISVLSSIMLILFCNLTSNAFIMAVAQNSSQFDSSFTRTSHR